MISRPTKVLFSETDLTNVQVDGMVVCLIKYIFLNGFLFHQRGLNAVRMAVTFKSESERELLSGHNAMQ